MNEIAEGILQADFIKGAVGLVAVIIAAIISWLIEK